MPLQCGTQWDALGHVFSAKNVEWYDARLVDSKWRAKKTGIEKTKDRMVGRGVLLDVARHKGRRIPGGRLRDRDCRTRKMCADQVFEIKRGDFVIVARGTWNAASAPVIGAAMRAGKRRPQV